MLANGALAMNRTPPLMVELVASLKPTSVLGKMSSERVSLPMYQTVCVWMYENTSERGGDFGCVSGYERGVYVWRGRSWRHETGLRYYSSEL